MNWFISVVLYPHSSKGRATTGQVYTKYSPSMSWTMRKSSSKYLTNTLQAAARPLFHWSNFQMAPTGTLIFQMHSPIKGTPSSPSTWRLVVASSPPSFNSQFIDPLNRRDLTRDELLNLDNYLKRVEAVAIHPPKVGNSLNLPRTGTTVIRKIEVSNSL